MDGLTPIVVALIGTAGTVAVAAIQARHRSGQSTTAARWREQAELEKARADLLEEQLEDERAKAASAVEAMRDSDRELVMTRRELTSVRRELDNAYSDLRAVERRRRPRAET